MGIFSHFTVCEKESIMGKRGDVMNAVIFNPLEEFEAKYQEKHRENTEKFLEDLVRRSGIDIQQNRLTVKQYDQYQADLAKLRKKLNWWRFLRVLMCITILLIPLVILKITPKIRDLRAQVEQADQRADELLAQANEQMLPLNRLFTETDALRIIESTIPLISFADHFTVEQEANMKINYDFTDVEGENTSTTDVLAGTYNENPFLFENRVLQTMGTETYHGYKTISWTETYRDSNGKLRTRTRSETLHATVTKPKPFYHNQVMLNYCAQGAPELSFSRDADHVEQRSERSLQRLVKRGERTLQKKTEEAISENGDFMSMSNTEFEVLFDALNRTNEVQFRTMFTPLAQTNMVDLLTSQVGYGDDFYFIKSRRTNRIVAEHSQGRPVKLPPDSYVSYSYDIIKENFCRENQEFFKAVYFDFAPIWAIPMYQERPVHSLKPIPDYDQLYSRKECEVLANTVAPEYVVHPRTQTQAIVKSSFIGSQNGVDETCITAYSFDIQRRTDYVTVHGGDGHFHSVAVDWDDYLPLEHSSTFYIAAEEAAQNQSVIARRNGLCIFQ